jgi:hypothetical protein
MNAHEYVKNLGNGIDTDWLKVKPTRTAYQKAKSQGISIPQLFKERGFNHIRLRIQDYTLGAVGKGIHTTFLEEIAAVVTDCLDANILPIVAFQGEDFKLNPIPAERLRVLNWWEEVATRLVNFDERVAFNIIIETTGAIKDHNDELNLLYQEAYQRIHDISPQRIIAVCPNSISSPERLPELVVPGNGNVFVESHFYAAGPSPTNPAKLWTTGTEAEKNLLRAKVQLMSNWHNTTGHPIWLGAILPGNYSGDESSSDLVCSYTVPQQVEFFKFALGLLKEACIPYAINACNKYFDYQTFTWIQSQTSIVDAALNPNL